MLGIGNLIAYLMHPILAEKEENTKQFIYVFTLRVYTSNMFQKHQSQLFPSRPSVKSEWLCVCVRRCTFTTLDNEVCVFVCVFMCLPTCLQENHGRERRKGMLRKESSEAKNVTMLQNEPRRF